MNYKKLFRFSNKITAFQKITFKVKPKKISLNSNSPHIRRCRSLKRRAIFKNLSFCVKPKTSSNFTRTFGAKKQPFFFWLFGKYETMKLVELNCLRNHIKKIRSSQNPLFTNSLKLLVFSCF